MRRRLLSGRKVGEIALFDCFLFQPAVSDGIPVSTHPSGRGGTMARVVEEEGNAYGDGGSHVSPAVSAGEAVSLSINGQVREVAIPNSVPDSPHGDARRRSSDEDDGGGRSPARQRTQL